MPGMEGEMTEIEEIVRGVPHLGCLMSWSATGEEIVRCRDCGQAERAHGMLWCRHWEHGTEPGAYCAWGEKVER